jgi:hypothetical protein
LKSRADAVQDRGAEPFPPAGLFGVIRRAAETASQQAALFVGENRFRVALSAVNSEINAGVWIFDV